MYDRWLISVAVYAPGQFPELLSLQCFDMESIILFAFCVASLVLYVSHAIPDAVLILASMLLLCIISNARKRSLRLQVCSCPVALCWALRCLDSYVWLGAQLCAFRLALDVGFCVVFFFCWLPDLSTFWAHCLLRATLHQSALRAKKLERRTQKMAAKRKRSLIFAYPESQLL